MRFHFQLTSSPKRNKRVHLWSDRDCIPCYTLPKKYNFRGSLYPPLFPSTIPHPHPHPHPLLRHDKSEPVSGHFVRSFSANCRSSSRGLTVAQRHVAVVAGGACFRTHCRGVLLLLSVIEVGMGEGEGWSRECGGFCEGIGINS